MGGLRQQASTLALEVCSRCTRNPIQVSLLQARLVTIPVATTVAGTKDRFILAAIESSTCAAKGGLCMIRSHRSAMIVLISAPADMMTSTMSLRQARLAILGAKTTWWNADVKLATCVLADGATGLLRQANTFALEARSRFADEARSCHQMHIIRFNFSCMYQLPVNAKASLVLCSGLYGSVVALSPGMLVQMQGR